MLTKQERAYAIFKAVYFGVLPSWFYEPNCHYHQPHGEGQGETMNYWEHLVMNMYIVKHLVKGTEHPCTHDFHKMRVRKWVRWQYK